MKVIADTIPGYRVYEYLLILNPHEELCSKILRVKNELSDTCKVPTVTGAKPFMGLVTFTQYEMMEERIISQLKVIAMGYHPFKVELKDFGNFPSHTIYINAISKIPIQNLVKKIRSEAQRLMKINDDNKPYFIMEPHIAIAAKLKHWQYEKGWQEYGHKHFAGRFIAEAMLLLKRPTGEKRYQVVERFEFQNLSVAIRQGELFSSLPASL